MINSDPVQKVGSITSTNGAEITAFDPASARLFVVAGSIVEIQKIDNTGTIAATGSLLTGFAPPPGIQAIPNSVAIKNGIVAVAYALQDTTTKAQLSGRVSFYNAASGAFLNSVVVGALPDMLTFTPDGTKVLVANEGEPNSYGQATSVDPEGSVSIINIAGGVATATVQTADFTSFNSQMATLKAAGVRITGPGATVAQDLEPEYIAVSPDGLTAWVTLQENNAIATLDIATAKITKILPLGAKNFNLPGNGIDASDRDLTATTGKINIQNQPAFGLYQPDAIASFSINGKAYYITANEGDSRDYPGFKEEVRVGASGYVLDPTKFPNAATLKQDANLGRLTVTNATGDTDGDGDFDRIESFGARSFSIWDASGKQIFDSGDQLEQITAAKVPTLFNSDGTAASFDTRSDNKGPEPEGVVIGVINNRTYAFIGLERTGDVIIYDVTTPTQPQFVQYLNTPEDIGIEGLTFISAADSPTGKPLLVTAAEVSKTVSVFEIDSTSQSAFPNGVASGDTTQNSTVLWTRANVPGTVTFEYSTKADFSSIAGTKTTTVTNPLQPVKVDVTGLTANTDYFYRVSDANNTKLGGKFSTAAALGTKTGLKFGVAGDWRGELAPYPAIANADTANLKFFVELGDTIYGDVASPAVKNPDGTEKSQAMTLADYRAKNSEVYSSRYGQNTWGDLRASTSILATIDDHEVTNDFAGGQNLATTSAASQALYGANSGLINDSPLYENGLQAFQEFNPIRDLTYSTPGDARTDGERKLYRANTFGSDAATFVLDARSFRDLELPGVTNVADQAQVGKFLTDAFDPKRTMLGKQQVADLKRDLLQSQKDGVTWKFIMVPEPIQNIGVLAAADRFEGYAAERTEILKYINDNKIDNVVFVSADIHGTLVNNLTYQTAPGQAQIATSAFEITTGSVGYSKPFGPTVAELGAALGVITPAQKAVYDSLPTAGKDTFIKGIVDGGLQPLGYDPLGLDKNLSQANGLINAKLLQGDYVATHVYSWTEFNIDKQTQKLTATTYGIEPYTRAELEANPEAIISRQPKIVSQFEVTPTLAPSSFAGTAGADNLVAGITPGLNGFNDLVFAGAGNDTVDIPISGANAGNNRIDAGSGDDTIYVANKDRVFGSAGDDIIEATDAKDYRISGGAGNDTLFLGANGRGLGGDGNDRFFAGSGGNNLLSGGAGADQFWITNAEIPNAANTIVDFQIGTDVIGIQGAKSLGISSSTIGLTQVGADTSINFGGQTLAVLIGIQASSLTPGNASQFVFG
jgi:phosphodiesterase/alkaline phosphatase D-like protein